MSDDEITITETEREFHTYDEPFNDDHGKILTVRESSSAEGPHVWLCIEPPKQHPTLFSPHLSVKQATALRDRLNAWLEEVPKYWGPGPYDDRDSLEEMADEL